MCSYSKIHGWQTRLALIKPSGDPSACLELSLVVVDLVDLNTGAVINHDTLVTYDALSYAWGTASPSAKCTCDGNTILLRDNLDSALKYLRKPQDERYVWIDFLCINQDDLVEKAVQIPRMKNIYSKASTVIVWLGESQAVASILGECQKSCGYNVGTLTCFKHKNEAWKSILEYAWFRRTWVRQEVFAAEQLNVCSPYFSVSWELFIAALHISRLPFNCRTPFRHEAIQNLYSLDQLYLSRPLELLDLLRQGKGFQAAVSNDHIFSVLGMVSTPKHSTKETIPVTYDKTYHEVCGDVTRYVIRESCSISILQLCTWQRDRSYAFDWPTIEWSDPTYHGFALQHDDEDGILPDWFNIENPIREVNDSRPSENTDSSLISSQSVSNRPLVLYGRVWGILTGQLDNVTLYDQKRSTRSTRERSVSAYSLDHATDQNARISMREDVDEYRELIIFKSSVTHCFLPKGGFSSMYEHSVGWRCYGCVSEGDIFVSLDLGPQNVILRRCSISGDMFEVVGWNVEATTISEMGSFTRNGPIHDARLELRERDQIGPRGRFEIR